MTCGKWAIKLTYEHYLCTDEEWEDYYCLFFEPEPAVAFDLYYTQDGLAVIDIAGSWRREYDGFYPNNFFSYFRSAFPSLMLCACVCPLAI